MGPFKAHVGQEFRVDFSILALTATLMRGLSLADKYLIWRPP